MEFDSLLSRVENRTNYIIDIGASGGSSTDPVYSYITNNSYKGLCIEAVDDRVQHLKQVVAPSFDIYSGYCTPQNVLGLFQQYNVPSSPDILKIDIDSYDLAVLRSILTLYKPKIIIAEINEKIPPPVQFEVLFKENYIWDESHFYGFSIASGEKVMNHYGYKILKIVDLCNILCVDKEICESLGLSLENNVKNLYQKEYTFHFTRLSILPWNENVNYWQSIESVETLRMEIQNYFETKNDRSKFSIKTKRKDVDFLLH